jgi:recombination endonuclease VII
MSEQKKRLYGGQRSYLLKLRYGVTEVQLEWLKLQQGGLCAICHEAPAVHVDHDHRTKQVRGVLCFNCNRGLGYLDDDLETLYRAADYLESHGVTT